MFSLVNYDCMVADVNAVLETLLPKDTDVQTIDEKWYTMRIHPYQTIDNEIEGAVIIFSGITDHKLAEESLQKAYDEIQIMKGIIPICANC